MQRDVEFEVEMIDKSGGFIGALYFNKNENAAVALVREGLATVHSFSADALAWARQLYDAEVCLRSHSFCDLSLWLSSRRKQRKKSGMYVHPTTFTMFAHPARVVMAGLRRRSRTSSCTGRGASVRSTKT